jgi:O-antigen ligase
VPARSASATDQWATKERELVLDILGLGLFGAAVLWTYISAWVNGGSADAVVAVLVAVVLVFVIARLVADESGWIVPGAVAMLAATAAVVFLSDLAARGPLTGPLGYSNASAALYLQGSVAACMGAVAAPKRLLRVAGLVLAVALAVTTVLAGSDAASLLLLLPLAGLVVRTEGGVRKLIVVFLGLFLIALALSMFLGAIWVDGRSDLVGRVVEESLSGRRPALWHDAMELTMQRPLVGVGPGRFREESPLAVSDSDAAWAHNGFLQQGAEGGVPALVLAVSIFVWGFARLLSIPLGRGASLAAASLTAVGIHACVDYVLHFPILPMMAAALVGAAVGAGPRSVRTRSRIHERQHTGP